MEWDSPLKDEKLTAWVAWIDQLPLLSNIHVDRCLKPYRNGKDVKSVQVHVFCDASTKAYATVAYLRTEFDDGETVVRFIMARGKVVPMTSQTVPRLELLAAVLGVKLSLTIKRALKLKNAQFNYWTDSLNVVCWIRSESKDLQMFVSNRTSYIQKQTDESTWRWVDTLSNPADIASRGALIDRLQGEEIWWHGPEFLPNDCDTWPKEKVYDYTPDALKEFKKSALQEQEELNQAFALLGWTPNLDPSWRYPFENVSRWEDLLQRIARLFRYMLNLKDSTAKPKTGTIPKEHQESKAQGNHYVTKCRFISPAQRTRRRPNQGRKETRRKEARVGPSLSHFPTSPRRTNGGGEETNSHLRHPNHSTRILRRRDQAAPGGQRSDETESHSSTSAHSGRRRNPKDQL